MKVKLTRLLAIGGQTFSKGETVDVAPAEGKALVKKGLATPVEAGPDETPSAGPAENTSTGPDTTPTAQTETKSAEQVKKVEPFQVGTNLTDLGGGWYLLSNGEKVQGKEAALEAQKALDAEAEAQKGGDQVK